MAAVESNVELEPEPEEPGELSIVLHKVHVVYNVFQEARLDLKSVMRRGLRPRARRDVHALKGVTLTIRRGETVGIVGRNGSGKSTMLRAIAGLLPVTSGTIYASSRPTLLGVGAVLQPALSGRRNIYLGGLAIGLSRAEIDERFDDIVKFAELEHAIEFPLRTYSSGMKARLQFSIATAVVPEILLVDEALAVGDREFRRKSYQRIAEIHDCAGTVLLVTHNAREIVRSCSRAILIDQGRVLMDGPAKEVVNVYTGGDTED